MIQQYFSAANVGVLWPLAVAIVSGICIGWWFWGRKLRTAVSLLAEASSARDACDVRAKTLQSNLIQLRAQFASEMKDKNIQIAKLEAFKRANAGESARKTKAKLAEAEQEAEALRLKIKELSVLQTLPVEKGAKAKSVPFEKKELPTLNDGGISRLEEALRKTNKRRLPPLDSGVPKSGELQMAEVPDLTKQVKSAY